MKTRLLFLLILFTVNAYSQVGFQRNDFYTMSTGLKFYSGLDELNNVLSENGHLPVSQMGFCIVSSYLSVLEKVTVEGVILTSYTNNTSESDSPHVIFTDLEAKVKFSYIFIGQEGHGFFSEIGASLGPVKTSFSLVFPDSAAHFNEALNGQTNYYYDQAIGFGFSPHLRIGKRNLDAGRPFVFFDLGYQLMFNKYKWRLSDLPLDKTNGLSLRAGISLPLRLKSNSYEN